MQGAAGSGGASSGLRSVIKPLDLLRRINPAADQLNGCSYFFRHSCLTVSAREQAVLRCHLVGRLTSDYGIAQSRDLLQMTGHSRAFGKGFVSETSRRALLGGSGGEPPGSSQATT